ncbi:MAG: exodeoxyribonuclease III, partial [Pseudomonadota bacterium]
CADAQFPKKAVRAAGYEHIALNGRTGRHAGQSGVAILSRIPLADVSANTFCSLEDGRHIAATLPNGTRVHNFYVPAGGDEPDPETNPKFAHKLKFLEEMAEWLPTADAGGAAQVLVGDLNIAPSENDVWSHKQLLNVVSHTPVEVEGLGAVRRSADYLDMARELIPEPEPIFTWWSYRAKDWRASNRGRRLDHIWVSPALGEAATAKGRKGFAVHEACRSWEKPSDHAPVSLELKGKP